MQNRTNTQYFYIRYIHLLLFVCFLYIPFAVAQIPSKPEPARYIVDLTNQLDEIQQEHIEQEMLLYYRSTSNQLVTVIVPTLGGMTVENYAFQLAESWGIGEKDKDNGVLLLIAVKERKTRIEVGDGLEGAVTDVEAKRILTDVLRGYLRKGQLYEGIEASLAALKEACEGEFSVPGTSTASDAQNQAMVWLLFKILMVVGLLIVLGFIYSNISERRRKKRQKIYMIDSALSNTTTRKRLSNWYYPSKVEEMYLKLEGKYKRLKDEGASMKRLNDFHNEVLSKLKKPNFPVRTDKVLKSYEEQIKTIKNTVLLPEHQAFIVQYFKKEATFFEPFAELDLDLANKVRLDKIKEVLERVFSKSFKQKYKELKRLLGLVHWEELVTDYRNQTQILDLRIQLFAEFSEVKNIQYASEFEDFYSKIKHLFLDLDRQFEKRNDVELRELERKTLKDGVLEAPLWKEKERKEYAQFLQAELHFFSKNAEKELSEKERKRLSDAANIYKTLLEKPEKILEYDIAYLKKMINDRAKKTFWKQYQGVYSPASISSTQKTFNTKIGHIKKHNFELELVLDFYHKYMLVLKNTPYKFLKKIKKIKKSNYTSKTYKKRNSYLSYKDYSDFSFSYNDSSSSYSDFSYSDSSYGGGGFSGGGASGDW